jgi:peroxiredoxin
MRVNRRFVGALAASAACLSLALVSPGAQASSTSKVGPVKMECRKAPVSVDAPATVDSVYQLGTKAPGFTATRLDCGTTSLKQLANGHVTFINFLASWCEYCIAEAADLTAFYNKYHPKGLNGFGVDTADDGPPVGNPSLFYKKFHFPFPSVWDPNDTSNPVPTRNSHGKIWNAYATQPAVACIPTTFWLRKDGTIAVIYVGQMTPAAMLQNYQWAQKSQAELNNDPNYLATEAQYSKCLG